MRETKAEYAYHAMLLPGMLILLIFSILPMFGNVIAFQHFNPTKGFFGSEWTGLSNIRYMLEIPDSRQVFWNTIILSILIILFSFLASVGFALLLNELKIRWFKRTAQTIAYIPHFLSWVVLGGVIATLCDLDGIVNNTLAWFGVERILFLGSNDWFRPIVVGSQVWKEFGYGTIVYLAAMAGINPALYEAASIDGASRLQRVRHITLPGIAPVMLLMLTLSLGQVLNGGQAQGSGLFEQILNLYNPLVYRTGDILDTYVYRTGLIQMQYGLATAVGLLKSVVSFVLIVISYRLASRYAGYRIF